MYEPEESYEWVERLNQHMEAHILSRHQNVQTTAFSRKKDIKWFFSIPLVLQLVVFKKEERESLVFNTVMCCTTEWRQ